MGPKMLDIPTLSSDATSSNPLHTASIDSLNGKADSIASNEDNTSHFQQSDILHSSDTEKSQFEFAPGQHKRFAPASCSSQSPSYSPTDLPPSDPVSDPVFELGNLDTTAFMIRLDAAYDKCIHWKRNCFKLPSGNRYGKAFVAELARLYGAFASSSALESVALKAVTTFPILVLQKPHTIENQGTYCMFGEETKSLE